MTPPKTHPITVYLVYFLPVCGNTSQSASFKEVTPTKTRQACPRAERQRGIPKGGPGQ